MWDSSSVENILTLFGRDKLHEHCSHRLSMQRQDFSGKIIAKKMGRRLIDIDAMIDKGPGPGSERLLP